MSTYVIGAGVTGLSFAVTLGYGKVLESNPGLGGKASSYNMNTHVGKFTFDIGGHWFHHQNAPKVLQLLEGLSLEKHARQAFVYWEGGLYDFPLQQSYKTHADNSLVQQIDRELAALGQKEATKSQNYSDMLLNSYGPTLFERFFRDYNVKMFGVSDLSQIQIGKYEEIRNVRTNQKTEGYNSYFYYPKDPLGAQAIPVHLAKDVQVRFNSQVQSIHLNQRTISINKQTSPWETIISTIPLPRLVSMIADVDCGIAYLSQQLRASRGLILNLGVKRNLLHANKSWIYLAEMKYHFYRIGFYSNVQPDMAPEGYSSMYVECSPLFFKNKQEALYIVPQVIRDLISIGMIEDESDIVTLKPIYLEQNYCLPDNQVTSLIQSYLQQYGIYSIGRYGSWHWSSQHEDMQQAISLADELRRTINFRKLLKV
ncbi:protoporphyrinogen/coproporphyrinogen oxidase [Paenibacillus foliorum]|uniref:protoporphyrinogen/coproporphyrinogen oxidase n=1 Tax=Paenibacillus foliorum TaxID=2654974 RepID=UPI001492F7C1|nr:FAD-dependent oxidoreductase [Paenibacillus foliorum]